LIGLWWLCECMSPLVFLRLRVKQKDRSTIFSSLCWEGLVLSSVVSWKGRTFPSVFLETMTSFRNTTLRKYANCTYFVLHQQCLIVLGQASATPSGRHLSVPYISSLPLHI
jgi:hypothetical protein